ncbi:cellulose synthase/poly-beta-1,6-N-acetylglucosamine synthase-like glycosyltransferase [Pseudoclavibacter sp. JAI123]|uniref:glycosyltransferase family 2 protein n=1 Tax=Pseudoclavibacter sp. JAI123 TaxID=2723065 RepID=UPI0015CBB4E0|nr:glycosyltransferase family 2 protein [Pseudoclavibacter sp. JAI123]NYF12061.1 cellulose synthase/poly-beta-1,6-N-acetylglucosamine synthase-like glycosyltransferase [Pseudoclavibacter sp. JAI123]
MRDTWPLVAVLVTLLLTTFSLSTVVWSIAGLARVASKARRGAVQPAEHPSGASAHPAAPTPARRLVPADVAILIAAHNESLVISDTIRSAASQVPLSNVFIASDGSSDDTVAIGERAGASVLDLFPNRGKAGALTAAIEHFALRDRFEVVLLLDADTQLRGNYLTTGLPLFDEPDVVAVAGRATTVPYPRPTTRMGRLLTDHRERVYVFVQYLQKYGQAARGANAVTIVPGFASMYRTSVLEHVDIAAKGLTIEDYNMTFEVHAKRLGRIAFDPGCAIAETQDPVTLREYTSQMRRWSLGFWQTIRRHGMHQGVFWTSLFVGVVEVLFGSVVLALILPAFLISLLAWLSVEVWAMGGETAQLAAAIAGTLPPIIIAAGLLVPDAIMTLIVAFITGQRPHATALLFPFVRILDALICLRALVDAYLRPSDGRWRSPTRRAFSEAHS